MILSELITKLVDARITLTLENGGLSVNAPKGALTPEIMTSLKMYKEDLIKHLKASSKHSQKIIVADRKQNICFVFSATSVVIGSN